MAQLQEVHRAAKSLEALWPLATPTQRAAAEALLAEARQVMAGSVLWHINSTPRGGGVAEILQALVGYARGAGLDARWLTLQAPPEFFRITKRLHHALHGSPGDGSPLGESERRLVDEVSYDNADEFLPVLAPGDVVHLHDPQTAGLIPILERHGAQVLWRCHVGTDARNEHTEEAWRFLRPLLQGARAHVFSRARFMPYFLKHTSAVIHPSIDPFSPKNQPMRAEVARSILTHVGLIRGPEGADRSFLRTDGTPGRVDRVVDLISSGAPPSWETPLVVQISRWDPLKDPIGVMHGFVALMRQARCAPAHLVLAGPSVHAVADDPEAAATLDAVTAAWRQLPAHERSRISLASLPMTDVEENGAIVNALQRHASVVVQKSLEEGFGLTVTEAMWKQRPLIASSTGGVQEQIEDGVHGLLLADPGNLAVFAELLGRLLNDPLLGERLGAAAGARVREEFLSLRQLVEELTLAIALARGQSPSAHPLEGA